MVGQVGNLSYQFSLFQGEFSELVKDSSENVGQDAILSHEFSSFPGVAHCDMNDPFEIERLAPDNRLCQGGENKNEIATSLRAIAFYLAPFGKAPWSSKALPGWPARCETDFFIQRISV
jgi:hypothetical protein